MFVPLYQYEWFDLYQPLYVRVDTNETTDSYLWEDGSNILWEDGFKILLEG